jgi:putative ABC transport system ATP-binding protein
VSKPIPQKTGPSTPLVSLKDVELTLGQGASKVHILRKTSLEVLSGETLGLVGPSGSGKTSLLMVLAGLERPQSGSIMVAGQELTQLSEDKLALFRGQQIGIVFQSFHLVPTMTALENVAVPLELAGDRQAFDKAEAELKAVGLGERLTHYPGELSGGEQQRVAVARALAPQPAMIVADEPTGNLDKKTGDQITELLFNATKDRKTTLILVTHDMNLAKRCDRVMRMREGRVEAITNEMVDA